MDSLVQIYSALNKKEIILLNKLYKSQDSKAVSKSLHLLNIVKNNKTITAKKAASLLYQTDPDSRFSHLKSDITQTALNSLLFQCNSKKHPTTFYEGRAKCKTLQLQAEILFSRGKFPTGIKLLSNALMIAGHFGLKFEFISIYDIAGTWLDYPEGSKLFDNHQFFKNLDLNMLGQIIDAEKCHTNLIISNWYIIDKSQFDTRFFLETYNHLKTAFKQTSRGPETLKYWYFNMTAHYFRMKRDYNKALRYSMKLLKMVNNRSPEYSVSQKAEAKLLTAILFLHLKDHGLVREQINDIIKDDGSGILNQSLAMEILFLVNFYDKKYEEAEKVINKYMQDSRFNFSEINTAKWIYFKANLEFVKGSVLSMDILDQAKLLIQDTLGWNLGFRLLEILIIIEKKDYDMADCSLHSLVQLLRHKKGSAVERSKCICRILTILIKYECNYEKAAKFISDDIDTLKKSKNKNYHWDPLGYEIIRFDTWLKNKILREDFYQKPAKPIKKTTLI